MTPERKNLSDLACSVTLIGGGKMGSALLVGWLDAGLDPSMVRVADPNPSPSLRAMAAQRNFAVDTTQKQLNPGVLVLAVKPQIIDSVSEALAPMMGDACVVLSIMAGIKLDRLRAGFPAAKAIVRGMPNLAAAVGVGATVVVPEPRVQAGERELTERLLGVSGSVEWLDDEELMDAGTALSGSGPGYVLLRGRMPGEGGGTGWLARRHGGEAGAADGGGSRRPAGAIAQERGRLERGSHLPGWHDARRAGRIGEGRPVGFGVRGCSSRRPRPARGNWRVEPSVNLGWRKPR